MFPIFSKKKSNIWFFFLKFPKKSILSFWEKIEKKFYSEIIFLIFFWQFFETFWNTKIAKISVGKNWKMKFFLETFLNFNLESIKFPQNLVKKSPKKLSIPNFQSEFYQVSHTKAEYMERGPSICRYNPVFGALT